MIRSGSARAEQESFFACSIVTQTDVLMTPPGGDKKGGEEGGSLFLSLQGSRCSFSVFGRLQGSSLTFLLFLLPPAGFLSRHCSLLKCRDDVPVSEAVAIRAPLEAS